MPRHEPVFGLVPKQRSKRKLGFFGMGAIDALHKLGGVEKKQQPQSSEGFARWGRRRRNRGQRLAQGTWPGRCRGRTRSAAHFMGSDLQDNQRHEQSDVGSPSSGSLAKSWAPMWAHRHRRPGSCGWRKTSVELHAQDTQTGTGVQARCGLLAQLKLETTIPQRLTCLSLVPRDDADKTLAHRCSHRWVRLRRWPE